MQAVMVDKMDGLEATSIFKTKKKNEGYRIGRVKFYMGSTKCRLTSKQSWSWFLNGHLNQNETEIFIVGAQNVSAKRNFEK